MTAAPTTATSLRIDPVHSTIEFAVTHMPFSWFRARFRDFEGTISLNAKEPECSLVTATIKTASIDVLGERFRAVMRSEDFFDTERWPEMTFRSTGVEQVDGDIWHIAGDLTIRGTTRELTLVTRY